MGNICTNNFEKQQHTQTAENAPRNTILYKAEIGSSCKIDLINGLFKFHRGQTLLLITTQSYYQQYDAIKQLCPDSQKVFQTITSSRKILIKYAPGHQSRMSNSQYKTILICVLPQYKSEQAQQYNQQFRNVIKQVIESYKDITIQFSPTSQGHHSAPNQILLALMFRQISANCENTSFNFVKNEGIKINIISSQKKMINLIKYELLKTKKCTVVPCQQKQLTLSTI